MRGTIENGLKMGQEWCICRAKKWGIFVGELMWAGVCEFVWGDCGRVDGVLVGCWWGGSGGVDVGGSVRVYRVLVGGLVWVLVWGVVVGVSVGREWDVSGAGVGC